jgi:hypothetical protein
MTRMYKALTTLFGCAAVVLLVLSVLAVPTQQARADDSPGCQGQSCDAENPCPTGFSCVNGTCQIGCDESHPCPTGYTCEDGCCRANQCNNTNDRCDNQRKTAVPPNCSGNNLCKTGSDCTCSCQRKLAYGDQYYCECQTPPP